VLVVRKDRRLVCVDAVAWGARRGAPWPDQVVCSLNPVNGVTGLNALPGLAGLPRAERMEGSSGGSGDVAELLVVPASLRLSRPESRALEGVAEGLDNAALGARLYLSRAGVDYYLGRLRRKFRVRSRSALVARAYALGVLVGAVWPPRVDAAYVEVPSGDG
jgi:DNA-binding CsgD family transcriptional regulator